jgi:RsiW-degrading membrane proteinase PrsW (M82 family)
MLEILNRIFVAVLVGLALCGIGISLLAIATDFLGAGTGGEFDSMRPSADVSISNLAPVVEASDSPYELNLTVLTPPLRRGDLVSLEAYSEGRLAVEDECIADSDYETDDYIGARSVPCELGLPYGYNNTQEFGIYAVVHKAGGDIYSGPYRVRVGWSGYEGNLQRALLLMLALVCCAYLLLVFPAAFLLASEGMGARHPGARKGEYTMESLLNPLSGGATLLQKFQSFLVSPYFWGLELAGIFVILAYLFVSAGAWRSLPVLASFALSGLVAFVVPFLWCAAFWHADFRERVPLRIMVTFFLWGCVAALMAVGLNTVWGAVFELIGLGALGAMLAAPITEEFFKGSGLALLSEHHEYNSLQNGLVFGFAIGMGFSFIENWMYLIDNPFSADIWGWLALFLMRSVLFSANHGIYTAITGGAIGLLKERKFAAPALGMIPGVLVAAVFHAAHNSGAALADLFGLGGILAYCCILIPLVDYGALLLLLALFIWAVLRKRRPGAGAVRRRH